MKMDIIQAMCATFGPHRISGPTRSTATYRVSGMVYSSSTFVFMFSMISDQSVTPKIDAQELSHGKLSQIAYGGIQRWCAACPGHLGVGSLSISIPYNISKLLSGSNDLRAGFGEFKKLSVPT